jgi:putative transcriptional regulator
MVRKSLDEILATQPEIDRAMIEATTEEDIRRQMIEDGESSDAGPPGYEFVVPPQVVRAPRRASPWRRSATRSRTG